MRSCVLILLFSFSSFAQNIFENRALDFEFEDIKIGDSISGVINVYPDMIRESEFELYSGMKIFRKASPISSVSSVLFGFLDNMLYSIGIFYNSELVTYPDEQEQMVTKMVTVYGEPDDIIIEEENTIKYIYEFQNVNRKVTIKRAPEGILFMLQDLKKFDEIQSRSKLNRI